MSSLQVVVHRFFGCWQLDSIRFERIFAEFSFVVWLHITMFENMVRNLGEPPWTWKKKPNARFLEYFRKKIWGGYFFLQILFREHRGALRRTPRSTKENTEEDRGAPRSTKEKRAEPRRTEQNQGEPRRTEENRGEPRRTEENQGEPRRTEENWGEQRGEQRGGPRRTEENRGEPSRTEENRGEPRKTEENRAPIWGKKTQTTKKTLPTLVLGQFRKTRAIFRKNEPFLVRGCLWDILRFLLLSPRKTPKGQGRSNWTKGKEDRNERDEEKWGTTRDPRGGGWRKHLERGGRMRKEQIEYEDDDYDSDDNDKMMITIRRKARSRTRRNRTWRSEEGEREKRRKNKKIREGNNDCRKRGGRRRVGEAG